MNSSKQFLVELDGLTDRLIAYRFVRRIEMQSRLADKLKRAGGIVARQYAKIEARVDNLLEREKAIERKTEQSFAPHESMLNDTEKQLDSFEHELAGLTNDPFQHGEQPEQVEPEPKKFVDHPPHNYTQ